MQIRRCLCIMLLCGIVFVTGDNVDVRFYGESLCPYCARLTTNALSDVFRNGIMAVANFRYIGWGNVRKDGEGYRCQHGPLECKMNTVLNCAQQLSKDQFEFFQFLYCIESEAGPGVDHQIPGCAKLAGIGLKPLESCYQGKQGEELDASAHNATDALHPPHTYVPWVTVNGQPIFDAIDNLGIIICAAYQGQRPEACSTTQSAKQTKQPGSIDMMRAGPEQPIERSRLDF